MKYKFAVCSNDRMPAAAGVIMQNTEANSNYQAVRFQLLSFGFEEADGRHTQIRAPGGPTVIQWIMSHPNADQLPLILLQMKPVCKFKIEETT